MPLFTNKPLLLFILLSTLFLQYAKAGLATTDENENEIYSAFTSFAPVEEMILKSDSLSEDELKEYFPDIKVEVDNDPLIWVRLNTGNKVWILPSFYWGCFFGAAGVFIAGIITEFDNELFTDSIAGMVINCTVLLDVSAIVTTYYLLKWFIEIINSLPSDAFSGCTNVW